MLDNFVFACGILFFSLIFTILPILLNLSASFYIISKENSENPEFHKYFLNNQKLVSICTAISGADIEILYTLSSNFAGFNIFTAPFSEQAKKSIFWYALIGFCLEDIPQFSIQVITVYIFIFKTLNFKYLASN